VHDLDILIIGAGHNGLAMSGLLADAGRESLVVDRRDTLGGARQDHWDEFRLVTPNWTTSFPGWRYGGPDPDGFMGRDEIAARVARYAGVVGASVQLGAEVLRLAPLDGGGLRATTSCGDLTAREVVVATGSYHEPRIPTLGRGDLRAGHAAPRARVPQRGNASGGWGADRRLRPERPADRRGAGRGRPRRLRLGRLGRANSAPLPWPRHLRPA
jgi:cation diffusion facilitator CzcD-associated flavoprotein CzcO